MELNDIFFPNSKNTPRRLERKTRFETNGRFGVKTYGDSTVRHISQKALACDVDAMSGGTTCNILNAINIDEGCKDIKNVIIVAGQNELNPRHSKEEFLWILKNKTERLVSLAEDKRVAILTPPPQGFVDPECQLREFYFHDNLKELTELSANIQVWQNPLPNYTNDSGQHPSQEESVKLVKYLGDMAKKNFGEDLILDNAADDLLCTRNYYNEVNGLYKYGCAACASKERNKWRLLCDMCNAMVSDRNNDTFNVALEEYDAAVERQAMVMNPPLILKDVEMPAVEPTGLASDIKTASTRDRSPIKTDVAVNDEVKNKKQKKSLEGSL